MVAPAGP
jgi:hypothetical protein